MSEPPMPLYDTKAELCAWWIGENVFTLRMDWLAFIQGGHAFSARAGDAWLGPVKRGIMMDRNGHVIFWSPSEDVNGEVSVYSPPRPYRPPRPERPPTPNLPPRPYKPPRPSGGWSELSPRQWIAGGPPAEPKVAPPGAGGMHLNEITFDD